MNTAIEHQPVGTDGPPNGDSDCFAPRTKRRELALAEQLRQLESMSINELQQRFEEVIGNECKSRNKRYLVRRIAWRLQANAEGGLSERALRRAEELADDADIRVTPPRKRTLESAAPTISTSEVRDSRLPPVGNCIERVYKGRLIRVLIVADGFEYEGERFRSLSAIAKAVTGTHINGFLFFNLRSPK